MKKVFSLLFVALLALSAWADMNVTFVAGTTVGNNLAANAFDVMELDGVTITCTSGAFATNPYRFGGGSKTAFKSTVGNIKKVEITCQGSYSQSYGPDQFYGDGYSCHSGSNVGIWQGEPAEAVELNLASQSRVYQIVVTIEEPIVTELVPPVFHPDGGEFTGSLEVTLTCPTENAEIYYFEGEPDGDWTNWSYYSHPFYVTETKTFTAYSSKGGEISEYVTVTFTKVEQTVEAPVFTPASCGFQDRLEVTLACATPGATIYYSLDQEQWSQYIDPIPVTSDLTIYAKAKVGDVESEVVSATYTKLPPTIVDVTFDATVDKGDGDTNRHAYTIVKGPVTMFVGDGTVYSDHYRIYGGAESALKFTSAGAPILKIEFDGISGYTPSNLSLPEGQSGTYTTGGSDGTWEGIDNEVSFVVNSQVRCYTVTVTIATEYKAGDVNHDWRVSIADVTALINLLLTNAENMPVEADVNHSGTVNISDVTALINILLSGNAEY